MNIRVANCIDKDFKHFIVDSTRYFISELLPKNIYDELNIDIRFYKKLKEYGLTYYTEPNTILIKLRKNMSVKNIFETLAHELVHAKQFVLGQIDNDLDTWYGKKVTCDYMFQPWEVEANGLSYTLFFNYTHKHELWHIFTEIDNPYEDYKPLNIWKNK
jgi:hypothetical protein